MYNMAMNMGEVLKKIPHEKAIVNNITHTEECLKIPKGGVVIRCPKSKKNRQYNNQKTEDKRQIMINRRPDRKLKIK